MYAVGVDGQSSARNVPVVKVPPATEKDPLKLLQNAIKHVTAPVPDPPVMVPNSVLKGGATPQSTSSPVASFSVQRKFPAVNDPFVAASLVPDVP